MHQRIDFKQLAETKPNYRNIVTRIMRVTGKGDRFVSILTSLTNKLKQPGSTAYYRLNPIERRVAAILLTGCGIKVNVLTLRHHI